MKRQGFSVFSALFGLAFLLLILGFFYFFARASGRSADTTFKSVGPRIVVTPEPTPTPTPKPRDR
jgi:hypothetical protein